MLELAADSTISVLPGGVAVIAARRAVLSAVETAKTLYKNTGRDNLFSQEAESMWTFGKIKLSNAF